MLNATGVISIVGTFKMWGPAQESLLLRYNIITVPDRYGGMKKVESLDPEGLLSMEEDS